MEFSIGIGVSARHLHLCQKDMAKLFGDGAILHNKKDITQPGQFAAEEQVTLLTEKGIMMKLRVIGPLRKETQIELSLTDARAVGLTPPVRNSGDTAGSPGGVLIGPAGEVCLEKGIIVAARHLHLCPATAAKYGLKNGDVVSIRTTGERETVFNNVLVRTGEEHSDECHIDTDEANAGGISNGDIVIISI
ncbi:MAG: phosphate propanoyltransferase [Acholeplasmataceae bacterium]|nr:phosphate propanoyltransferase [Acholeplasmataceae bacterium]